MEQLYSYWVLLQALLPMWMVSLNLRQLLKNEIQISYIGYVTKKVKVGSQKVISVTLSEDAQQLDEVVVTAFGTGQKKETITGSIQSVRPSDLLVPSANLSSSFAGRLSGVIAYQRSGEPGQNSADFFIRGVATMNGATSPLIILDGVEVSKADLNSLDPEVIESFSVLKDATASAMYGTRGANGVLIIKTKSGSDLERPIIGVRIEGYVNTPIKKPEIVDGPTYMRLYNEAVTNQGTGAVLYSDERINGTINNLNPYIYPNVDWYKEVFKDATFNQKANFNVRGGTSKITYFMNVNMNHETGMLKDRSSDFFSYKNNIDYMKYAFQNNVDFHLSKSSTISLHLNVQLNDMHGPLTTKDGNGVGDIFSAIMGTNPVDFPVMFPQGSDTWYHWGGILAGNYQPLNPVALSSAGYKDTFESTVVANVNWDQKLDFITKGLSLSGLWFHLRIGATIRSSVCRDTIVTNFPTINKMKTVPMILPIHLSVNRAIIRWMLSLVLTATAGFTFRDILITNVPSVHTM